MRKNIIAGVLTVFVVVIIASVGILSQLYPFEMLMILVPILVIAIIYTIFSLIRDLI